MQKKIATVKAAVRRSPRRGRPSRFKNKLRTKVLTFTMSAEGHTDLAYLMASGKDESRSDVLEGAVRTVATLRRRGVKIEEVAGIS